MNRNWGPGHPNGSYHGVYGLPATRARIWVAQLRCSVSPTDILVREWIERSRNLMDLTQMGSRGNL